MSKTVLAVEDDEVNMRLLHDIIECLGHTCVLAHDGIAALTLVKTQKIDLILMDVQLPGLSGMEVIRHLKADRALTHIPIIAVTACAMAGDEDRILASGCDAYVSKPFVMLEFMGLIRTMLSPDRQRMRGLGRSGPQQMTKLHEVHPIDRSAGR
jgi:two-component system cell cycle response regulator DivK